MTEADRVREPDPVVEAYKAGIASPYHLGAQFGALSGAPIAAP